MVWHLPSGVGVHYDISEEGPWPIYFLPAIQFDRQYIPRRQLILLRRVAFGRHQYYVDRYLWREAVAHFTVHNTKRLRLRFGDVLYSTVRCKSPIGYMELLMAGVHHPVSGKPIR